MERNVKRICYTAVFDDYRLCDAPVQENSDWKFICYTDKLRDAQGWVYNVFPVKDGLLMNRFYKMLNYMTESIYVDGNVQLRGDLNKLWHLLDNRNIAFFDHNYATDARNCVYAEAEACIALGKESPERIKHTVDKMRGEGYPADNGLICGGVILRRHCQRVDMLMMEWFKMFVKYAKRDQLYLNYLAWALNMRIQMLPLNIRDSEFTLILEKNKI